MRAYCDINEQNIVAITTLAALKLLSADMNMKSIPRTVWIIPAVLLVIAVWRLPYGYYTFVRIVVCGIAAFIATAGFRGQIWAFAWPTLLLAIAVLFNPFVAIYLNRASWFYLDLGTAAAFLIHLFMVRQKST